jgi:hypothetical protein
MKIIADRIFNPHAFLVISRLFLCKTSCNRFETAVITPPPLALWEFTPYSEMENKRSGKVYDRNPRYLAGFE